MNNDYLYPYPHGLYLYNPLINMIVDSIREGDLVRKEYADTPGYSATAVEYVAIKNRDKYNERPGNYIILKERDPLKELGLGAVIRFKGQPNVYVKTNDDSYLSKNSGKPYTSKHFDQAPYEILSKGLQD